jgi:hypothetical protein
MFQICDAYKRVDSYGNHWNNMDGVIMGKRNGTPFNQYSMNVSSGDPYSGGTGSFATFFGRPNETRNNDVVLNYQLLSAGVYNIVTTVNTNYQALYVNSIEVANSNRNYTSNTFTISGRDILIGAVRDNTGTGILSPFKNNIFAFLDNDNHIYLISESESVKLIECITVTGIFDNPLDLENYTNCCGCKDKPKCFDFDKYGRLLIEIYDGSTVKSINQEMIDNSYAIAYDGGTKQEFNENNFV